MKKQLVFSVFCYLSCLVSYGQEVEELYDMSLEELLQIDVVSASKTAEKLSDAPGVIQVITAEEIDRFGALNLAEVLDRVTGMFNMGSFGYPQNVSSIRGDLQEDFDTHTLLLLNGRPLRESIYGGYNSSIYLSFPLSAVERIEVIRGPGSVLYGSNAYAGVVNIITKKASESSANVNLTAGSFEGLGVNGDFSVVNDDLVLTGAYQTFSEEGWEFTATDIDGDTRTIDYSEENESFLVDAHYKNLSVNVLRTQSEQRNFANFLPIWDVGQSPEDKRFKSTRSLIDLGYSLDFSDQVNSQVNVTYNGFRLEDNSGFSSTDSRSDDWIIEGATYYTPSDRWNLVLGGTLYQQTGTLDTIIGRYSNNWYSAYGQVDFKPIDRLKLIFGAQLNKIEGLETDLVPRLGAIYHLGENLGAKVLYSQSFRAPYAVETLINQPGFLIGNPELEAEKLTNLDVQLFYTSRKFEVYATYFDYSSQNLIIQFPNDPTGQTSELRYINLNSNTLANDDPGGRGYELEFKYIPNKNYLLTGSFSHQDNEVTVNNATVENFTYMPNNMFKLGLSYQTDNEAFTVGAFNSFYSSFNDDFGFISDVEEVNGPLSSFNLLSLNVKFNLTKLFKTSMSEEVVFSMYGSNLLNEVVNYPDYTSRLINSYPGRPGRALYGTLSIKF